MAEGGPLIVRHVSYVEGRGNIIVELPGADADAGCLSFVGMHMDVVPANPDTWCVLTQRSWPRLGVTHD